MIGEFQKQKDGTYTVSVKLQASQVELLNAICNTLGVNSYQIFQMFFYTLMRASAPMHELSPEIKKIMTLMESEAGWAETFNMANPNHLDIAQCILILQQEDKRGFGAVMIDRPWMSMKPEMVDDIDPQRGNPQMTENVDYILERVTEVTMRGIYRRLRLLGAKMGCRNLSDILLTMIDAQTIFELDEENRVEMKGEGLYDHRGRKIEYGKRTKGHGHRTPDSYAHDQRITFPDFDRDAKAPELNEMEGEIHDTR
jgi:hypothetical protein